MPEPPGDHNAAPKRQTRLDLLLVERGLADTRARAQALVLSGVVYANGQRVDKPGSRVAADCALSVRERPHPWVSRGGVKLAAALDHFGIDPSGRVCLDLGASTGGFSHVLLARGAERVYAVDVGHGQLAWSLRQDPRLRVLERLNARYLTAEHVPEQVSLIVCDVSFISLRLVLPPALARADREADVLALIKPQFEAGRREVGKGGIVREPSVRAAVCDQISAWLSERPGWHVLGLMPSPITGADGNVEFFIAARRDPSSHVPPAKG